MLNDLERKEGLTERRAIVIFDQLFQSIEKDDVATVEEVITSDPSAIRARNVEGLTPIVYAAYWGRREILDRLLLTAPELSFWEAATVGATPRVCQLIADDPDLVSAMSPDGFTALHLAVFFGHPETARALIAAGADVQARTTNTLDNQPLHAAVASSHPQARLTSTLLLLDAAAPIDERQSGGFTPLMSAAQSGDRALAAALLARGADPALRDDEGRSAVDHAKSSGHEDLVEMLERGERNPG